jgi:signal transduction histidine kinase/ActR/RegA family two-component response regulator
MKVDGDFLDLLVPPAAREQPRLRLRHRGIAKSLLSISAVVAVLLVAYLLVRRELPRQEALLFSLAIAFPTLGALFIRVTGRIALGLFLINMAGIGIVTLWCGLTGGITSVALPWFLPNLFVLSTFGDRRMLVSAAFILSTALAFLFHATRMGWLPPDQVPAGLLPAFALLSMVSSVAVVVIVAVAVAGEREKSKRVLREAKEAAEAANRAKSAFLSAMSHELRTPLNAVMISADLLKEDRDPPLSARQVQCADQIAQGGEVLLGLVNQVLEMSSIETGNASVKLESVPLADALTAALAVIQPLAVRGEVRLDCGADGGLWVVADPVGLRSVLINLLSNAVKFNSRPGTVTIASRDTGSGSVRIEIRDTGPGIPGTLREQALQPFNRLGAAGSRIEGTGLGLAIVDRLVRMMAGRFGFDSLAGEGSTFWVELPAGVPAQAAMAGGAALAATGPLSILVAEDHPVNQQLLRRTLEKWGHRVTLVGNGAEALAAIEDPAATFDVVLMDLLMPEMDGLEATRRIRLREAGGGRRLPVVAVTACATDTDRDACFESGMDGYLAKPFKPQDLAAILQQLPSTGTGSEAP